MCGPILRVKNILVSGNLTATVQTIRQVISLPFNPSSFEVTRLTYLCNVTAGQEAILQVTTDLSSEPIASFPAYTTGGYSFEQHDTFNITSATQGEHTFTIGGVFTGAIPPATTLVFSMNLKFTE